MNVGLQIVEIHNLVDVGLLFVETTCEVVNNNKNMVVVIGFNLHCTLSIFE